MEFLKAVRKRLGITPHRLGWLIGIRPVHNYYRYEKTPTPKRAEFVHFIVKVWRISGLPAEEFLELLENEPIPGKVIRKGKNEQAWREK